MVAPEFLVAVVRLGDFRSQLEPEIVSPILSGCLSCGKLLLSSFLDACGFVVGLECLLHPVVVCEVKLAALLSV